VLDKLLNEPFDEQFELLKAHTNDYKTTLRWLVKTKKKEYKFKAVFLKDETKQLQISMGDFNQPITTFHANNMASLLGSLRDDYEYQGFFDGVRNLRNLWYSRKPCCVVNSDVTSDILKWCINVFLEGTGLVKVLKLDFVASTCKGDNVYLEFRVVEVQANKISFNRFLAHALPGLVVSFSKNPDKIHIVKVKIKSALVMVVNAATRLGGSQKRKGEFTFDLKELLLKKREQE